VIGRLDSRLTQEDQPAGIAAFAHFDDGTQMVLTPALGLRLSIPADDRFIIAPPRNEPFDVLHRNVLAVGAGLGHVNAVWRVQCGAPTDRDDTGFTVMGSATASIEVNTAAPIGVRVERVFGSLTFPGDLAEEAGTPIQSQIRVLMVFEGRPNKDMTNDPRTVYDTSLSGGRLNVCGPGEDVCAPDPDVAPIIKSVPGGGFGPALLRVRFLHTPLFQNITLQVVGTEQMLMRLQPYPSFPGSDKMLIYSLLRYRNDASLVRKWQQAVVRCVLVLTDGREIEITTRPQTTYKVCQPSTLWLFSGCIHINLCTSFNSCSC